MGSFFFIVMEVVHCTVISGKHETEHNSRQLMLKLPINKVDHPLVSHASELRYKFVDAQKWVLS